MSNRNQRRSNGFSREDQDFRRPRRAPYDRSDRRAGNFLRRDYDVCAHVNDDRGTDDRLDEQFEQRELDRERRLREDCQSLRIQVVGLSVDQMEAALQAHNDKYQTLQRLGVDPIRLLDDRDVNAEWSRLEQARRSCRTLGIGFDDTTTLAVLEAAIDADYAAMEAHLQKECP